MVTDKDKRDEIPSENFDNPFVAVNLKKVNYVVR